VREEHERVAGGEARRIVPRVAKDKGRLAARLLKGHQPPKGGEAAERHDAEREAQRRGIVDRRAHAPQLRAPLARRRRERESPVVHRAPSADAEAKEEEEADRAGGAEDEQQGQMRHASCAACLEANRAAAAPVGRADEALRAHSAHGKGGARRCA